MNTSILWDRLWRNAERDAELIRLVGDTPDEMPGLAADSFDEAIDAVLDNVDWGLRTPVEVKILGVVLNEDDPCERNFTQIEVVDYFSKDVLASYASADIEEFLIEYEFNEWRDVRTDHGE